MYETLKHINEHIGEVLLIKDLAKRAGYSQWHFCVLFKDYTGLTVNEYISERRVRLAAADIDDGKRTEDISARYGYDTVSGFTKAFMRYFGCTPAQYRRDRTLGSKYEGRFKNMPKLSNRSAILRERAMEHTRGDEVINGQRLYNILKGFYTVPEDKRTNLRCVTASLEYLFKNFQPVLFEDELIVGYNYSLASTDYMEYWFPAAFLSGGEQTEDCYNRLDGYLEKSLLTPEQRAEIPVMLRGGYAHVCKPAAVEGWAEAFTPEQHEALGEGGVFALGYASNHTIIGHYKVINEGFEGILAKLRSERDAKKDMTDDQREFYDNTEKVLIAAGGIGIKYAEKLEETAAACQSPARANELRKMAEVCRQVPLHPARNLHEAVQALWFSHVLNTWEDGVNANSLGRVDQMLYPYYEKDIKSGAITREDAFELICGLWLKLYRDYDVQQCTIGGCDADGNSAVNELSYIMLEVTEALDFIRDISVRFDKNTDPAFVRRALEVVGHCQKGVPFFFNDESVIKAITMKGIDVRDARMYANLGCVETVLPGMSNSHPVAVGANVLKGLEYALGNGYSLKNPGKKCGLTTGDPCTFNTFEKLLQAVEKQIAYIQQTGCLASETVLPSIEKNYPQPYKSALTDGCLETGRDFNSRVKGPKYIFHQCMMSGIPNTIDSLLAIKELLYEKKLFTMEELLYQLKNNFPSEEFRQRLVNHASKYGNDIEAANRMAYEVYSCACDAVNNYPGNGEGYFASPFTFLWMIPQGALCAASPDGRKEGEILAYSMSPMQGRDFNGFTALLNSIAKLPTYKSPGITSAIVEADPVLFTDDKLDMMTQMLLSAAEMGLQNVQFNITDADTLRDAQKHPECYHNLSVRVSGYSQKFNLLDKGLQDHIIARTKHKTL